MPKNQTTIISKGQLKMAEHNFVEISFGAKVKQDYTTVLRDLTAFIFELGHLDSNILIVWF